LLLGQVETKSIPEIAAELQHLQQLASVGKLSSHDVHGGSMTVSNIGEQGVGTASPLHIHLPPYVMSNAHLSMTDKTDTLSHTRLGQRPDYL
jgi:pyruvate/2-oxoglutarate dehydrogenase complex dihydrolipoamide acyltransferase (E2) component